MANPTDFAGSNINMLAPRGEEERVTAVRAFQNGQCCVTCWELTDQERKSIAEGGNIFLSVYGMITAEGIAGMPPVFLATESIMREHVAQFGDTFPKDTSKEMDIIHGIIRGMVPAHREIALDKTLDELGFDSMDVFQMIMEVEEKFVDISVADDEWTGSMTVQQLVESILLKINKAS